MKRLALALALFSTQAQASDLRIPPGLMLCPTAQAIADPRHAGCWLSRGGQRIERVTPAVTWSQLIIWSSDGSETGVAYALRADADKLQVAR